MRLGTLTNGCTMLGLLFGGASQANAAALSLSGTDDGRAAYYIQPGQLLDIYVVPPSVEKQASFGYDSAEIRERNYNWRTGVNYHMHDDLELNLDARRNRRDPALSLGGNEDDATSAKMFVKPWQLRLGLSYRWGK